MSMGTVEKRKAPPPAGAVDGPENDGQVASDTSAALDQGEAPDAGRPVAPVPLEQQVAILERKLQHLRAWMGSVNAHMATTNPQLVKNARRLYIGGVPAGTTEEELYQFFSGLMAGASAYAAPGQSLGSCKITPDKGYAFLELRTAEEASNAMAFDGVQFKDTNLKVRRPSNYDGVAALLLGPVVPDPTLNLGHLTMCKTVVEDSWSKVFVGGLPSDWTDDQVKELLKPFGQLKSFNLVMDKSTGKSKGYCFCEFEDDASVEAAIAGLHMKNLNRKMLTVKRALDGNAGGPNRSQSGGSESGSLGRRNSGGLPLGAPLGPREGAPHGAPYGPGRGGGPHAHAHAHAHPGGVMLGGPHAHAHAHHGHPHSHPGAHAHGHGHGHPQQQHGGPGGPPFPMGAGLPPPPHPGWRGGLLAGGPLPPQDPAAAPGGMPMPGMFGFGPASGYPPVPPGPAPGAPGAPGPRALPIQPGPYGAPPPGAAPGAPPSAPGGPGPAATRASPPPPPPAAAAPDTGAPAAGALGAAAPAGPAAGGPAAAPGAGAGPGPLPATSSLPGGVASSGIGQEAPAPPPVQLYSAGSGASQGAAAAAAATQDDGGAAGGAQEGAFSPHVGHHQQQAAGFMGTPLTASGYW